MKQLMGGLALWYLTCSFQAGTATVIKAFGGSGHDYPGDVAVLADGDILVTGEFWGQMTVGSKTLTSQGEMDMFVVKISPDGSTVRWAQRGGGKYLDRGTFLFVDPVAGTVAVGGTCFGRVKFGKTKILIPGQFSGVYQTESTGSAPLTRGDAREAEETQFLATYLLTDGKLLAYPVFDRTLFEDTRIQTLSYAVVFTGRFTSKKRMNATTVLTSAGEEDVFVGEYTTYVAGPPPQLPTLRWAASGGGSENDFGVALDTGVIDGQSVAVVVGAYRGTATFGGSTTAPSNGETDVFVVKYLR